MMSQIVRHEVDWRAGRRLQTIPSGKPCDHMPVALVLQYEHVFEKSAEEMTRWDVDKLGMCLQYGIGRTNYLDALNQKMEDKQSEFERL